MPISTQLRDLYSLPGFNPAAHIHGVFGDPYPVVIPLRRVSKKRPAEPATPSIGTFTTRTLGSSATSMRVVDASTFDARWERQFAAISSPEELFLHASECHPAQSIAEWRWLLDHPLCDRGTALLIFWRNSPVYNFGDEPAGGWDRERFELVREIAGRCATGVYPSAEVLFAPAAFKGFSFLSWLTPAELDRVPAHMRVPCPGEPVPPLAAPDFEWAEVGGH